MANFLDKTGLTYLWSKILTKINAKKINQIEPLSKNLDTAKVTRLSTGNINTTTDTIGTLQTFQATATMKATADGSYPDNDSNVMMMNWDSTAGYSTQLAQRNITGEIKVRGQNKKTWTAWRTVLDSTNKDDYLTDYAKSSSIPTKTSELTNDSGYITAGVSNLSNYYTKAENNSLLAKKLDKDTITEYGNADFTYSDGFAAYNTTANHTQEPRATKYGRIVNLTGAFKTTVARDSTSAVVIGKVPSGCEPLNDVRVRQQGTNLNSYLLTVGKNGNLTAERYGVSSNTALPNGVWLNINATYISKS